MTTILAFVPLWLVLYFLVLIAFVRVWKADWHKKKNACIFAFYTQLFLTILWLILFFPLHALTLPLVAVIVLWFSVVVVTLSSWDIDRLSFWLLLPYLAWITFVMIANIAIWWLA